jgi:ribonucleoside-triphosphate reductase
MATAKSIGNTHRAVSSGSIKRAVPVDRRQSDLLAYIKIASARPDFFVRRSDDTMIPFDKSYITRALVKETGLAPKLYGVIPIPEIEASSIANEVETSIRAMNPPFLNTDLIRGMVTNVLMKRQKDHPEYALYRNLTSKVGVSFGDVWSSIWHESGFEDRENANMRSGNPEGIHKKIADQTIKSAVQMALPPHIQKAHSCGYIHIHQSEYPNRPFCSDYDLRYIFKNGLLCDGTGRYTAAAGPAQHGEVAVLHAVKTMAAGQCTCQGGQGLFNFNIFMAPYMRGLPVERVKQLAEMFLYETNETYVSRGGQLVFSSIQLEAGVPDLWKKAPVVMGGKILKETYGDYEYEARLFAELLLKKYIKGDKLGKMFFFPKPEIRLRKEYFKDPESRKILRLACELSSKFGGSYFDNVIPEYRDAEGQDCYQCCAYHFSEDQKSLMPKVMYQDGQHFSMGGNQVVTINLPRLAYKANGDDAALFAELRKAMDIAKEFLVMKRKWMLDFALHGAEPNLAFLTQRPRDHPEHPPLVDLEAGSLIIGFVGANEMTQYHTGEAMHESKNAAKFALRVLAEMESIREEYVKETGLNFAIARTPAESTASRFAVLDLMHFPSQAATVVKGDMRNWRASFEKGGRTNVPVYYTNGFMVDHGASVPIHKKIDIEENAFPLLSGGNIMNIFLGEHAPDPDALLALTEKIATQTQVGYWSYTTDLTACNFCFYNMPGMHDECPNCHSTDVEHYSRITGYYQATSSWNVGKQQELRDRYRYQLEDISSL